MNTEVKNLIQDLEVKLLQSDVRKSPEQLNELLADDFWEFGESGKQYNKKDIVKILPTLPEAKYTAHDFKVKELSPDTMLITYRLEEDVIDTKEKNSSLRSSIWRKAGNGYQMIFHQGTLVS